MVFVKQKYLLKFVTPNLLTKICQFVTVSYYGIFFDSALL